ncbi:hypothetical protein NDU88_005081 [Pleurodeles waltl]|uniref:Uncharacterized protein n=1 Tax=Pleurodeles waltl TaxID=8319 RepID=A0AAV7PEX3_PLEWA|nr:hypothetical protein NDU88_005081 [Pleurodeles waltl]
MVPCQIRNSVSSENLSSEELEERRAEREFLVEKRDADEIASAKEIARMEKALEEKKLLLVHEGRPECGTWPFNDSKEEEVKHKRRSDTEDTEEPRQDGLKNPKRHAKDDAKNPGQKRVKNSERRKLEDETRTQKATIIANHPTTFLEECGSFR